MLGLLRLLFPRFPARREWRRQWLWSLLLLFGALLLLPRVVLRDSRLFLLLLLFLTVRLLLREPRHFGVCLALPLLRQFQLRIRVRQLVVVCFALLLLRRRRPLTRLRRPPDGDRARVRPRQPDHAFLVQPRQ